MVASAGDGPALVVRVVPVRTLGGTASVVVTRMRLAFQRSYFLPERFCESLCWQCWWGTCGGLRPRDLGYIHTLRVRRRLCPLYTYDIHSTSIAHSNVPPRHRASAQGKQSTFNV